MFSTAIASLKNPLGEEEQKVLRGIEYCFTPEKQPKNERIKLLKYGVESIKKWREQTVVRFAYHSETGIIRSTFETNKELKEYWANQIRDRNSNLPDNSPALGLPDSEVKAYDGSETHSIFDIFQSNYYLKLFEKPKGEQTTSEVRERMWLLTEAIRLGSFDAIAFHATLTIDNLMKTDVLSEEKELNTKKDLSKDEKNILQRKIEEKKDNIIKNSVMVDFERLCKLYGATGYLHAAKELYELSGLFTTSPDKERKMRGNAIFDEAMKNIICASLLQNDAYSNHLQNTITRGRGIHFMGSIEPLQNATNFEEAKATIRSWYKEEAEFNAIVTRATDEIAAREQKIKELAEREIAARNPSNEEDNKEANKLEN